MCRPGRARAVRGGAQRKRHVAEARGLDTKPPACVVASHEAPGAANGAAAHVEEPALHRAVAQACRLFAQAQLELEWTCSIVLCRRSRKRCRQGHQGHRDDDAGDCRLRSLPQRPVADADCIRFAAGPRRQLDLDVASARWRYRHAPPEIAAARGARCPRHRAAINLEQPILYGAVAQPFGFGAEVQLDGEGVRSVMVCGHALESRAGAFGGAWRPCRHQRAVVPKRRVGARRDAADGAAIERQAVRRDRHHGVVAVARDQRVAEHKLCGPAAAQIGRASCRRRATEPEPDRRHAVRGVHRYRLTEGERHLHRLALGPVPVGARLAHRGSAFDGRALDLVRACRRPRQPHDDPVANRRPAGVVDVGPN